MRVPFGHIYLQYAEPIGSGFRIFALLSVVLFIPYVIVLYRRFGRVDVRRLWVSAAFLLFMLCAWALVLMPFPDETTAFCALRHVDAQVTPFKFVDDVARIASNQGTGFTGLWRNGAFVVRVFNVLLLLPLGVFLRRWWQRGLGVTIAVAFALSLAFEVTQWTGVWGLYQCAYRTFDVDDLIANTAGAAIGWALAPMFRFIPAKGPGDDVPAVDELVTVPRRLLAATMDFLSASFVGAVLAVVLAFNNVSPAVITVASRSTFTATLLIATIVIPIFWQRTPGQALLSVYLVDRQGERPGAASILLRALLVWLPIVIAVSFGDATGTASTTPQSVLVSAVALVWVVALIVTSVRGGGVSIADRWSGTRLRARS